MELPDIENGFDELAQELNRLSGIMTDDGVRRKALEAGASLIVERAKRIISSHKRTGTLERSISHAYNETDRKQDIGWGGGLNTANSAAGFYGRFLEKGYKPVTGKRRGGKLINKTPSGKFVRVEHLKPAFEAERENAANAMIGVYKRETGG